VANGNCIGVIDWDRDWSGGRERWSADRACPYNGYRASGTTGGCRDAQIRHSSQGLGIISRHLEGTRDFRKTETGQKETEFFGTFSFSLSFQLGWNRWVSHSDTFGVSSRSSLGIMIGSECRPGFTGTPLHCAAGIGSTNFVKGIRGIQ
jgi:hypothetical protein